MWEIAVYLILMKELLWVTGIISFSVINVPIIIINNVDPMFAKITDTNKRYYERFMDLEHQYFV